MKLRQIKTSSPNDGGKQLGAHRGLGPGWVWGQERRRKDQIFIGMKSLQILPVELGRTEMEAAKGPTKGREAKMGLRTSKWNTHSWEVMANILKFKAK